MTAEELVYSFAIRQFHKTPINTERDLMCVCSDFANEFLAQPLASRMTKKEKERVRKKYAEAQSWLDEKPSFDNPNEQLRICAVAIQDRLESIFGKELFEEGNMALHRGADDSKN